MKMLITLNKKYMNITIEDQKIDIDDVISALDDEGYIVLKVHSMEQKDKINKFLEELYPHYNSRPEFITLNY
jgi:hypothetical protein